MIAELEVWVARPAMSPSDESTDNTELNDTVTGPTAVERAITYYRNHRERMRYPEYRRQGVPLTSSLMESSIKQINMRV